MGQRGEEGKQANLTGSPGLEALCEGLGAAENAAHMHSDVVAAGEFSAMELVGYAA